MDSLLGKETKFDPMAFKTSTEAVIDQNGFSFDSNISDFMGRTLTAP